MIHFPTEKSEILKLLYKIDPVSYANSRNFTNGTVTFLSPYISRGVLSTRDVFDYLKTRGFSWADSEKLIQELAWRDYFQTVWMRLGPAINSDIKSTQFPVRNREVPKAILHAETTIEAVDAGIQKLIAFGYMHNHQRMYTASLTCNLAHSHWLQPARWMYFHLLDADWASNACSWQWVAGSFSSKKYYANQENINRYCSSSQINTYLDVSYEELQQINIPSPLRKTDVPILETDLNKIKSNLVINSKVPTLIYNWYNLDFEWHKSLDANRILLIEPSVFRDYPISEKSMHFMFDLMKNIKGIQVFVGEFNELVQIAPATKFVFKQHPLNNYQGEEESRKFLSSVKNKNFNSFFGFWKAIETTLKSDFHSA